MNALAVTLGVGLVALLLMLPLAIRAHRAERARRRQLLTPFVAPPKIDWTPEAKRRLIDQLGQVDTTTYRNGTEHPSHDRVRPSQDLPQLEAAPDVAQEES